MSKTTPSTSVSSASGDGNEGEGNRTAARRFNEAEQAFVESGKVQPAARDAAPRDGAEAQEMKDAEAEGKRHAKDEDPAVRDGGTRGRTGESR